MFNQILHILIVSFLLTSCAVSQKSDHRIVNNPAIKSEAREVAAAVACSDLFVDSIQVDIIENGQSKKTKKLFKEITVELIKEVLPDSMNDAFWNVIEQISRNEDTKIKLNSNQMTLTKLVNDNLKLHSTYVYDPASNVFILKKIEYTEKNRNTKLLTSEPLYKNTNELRKDLSMKISELVTGTQKKTILIPAEISHEVHNKIENELSNLNLFTTHELLKMSELPTQFRLAKYQSMLAGRKMRNFIVNHFMEELIKKPIKMVVVSVLSVAMLSRTDFLANIVSTENRTPEWVAPSVVKMAGRYPQNTQTEIVYLMKSINNNKESAKFLEKNIQDQKKVVNIDDVDQLTIQHDSVNKKTYFVLTHENQNSTIDIYSLEIDPLKFPHLSNQAKIVSKSAEK